MLAALLTVTMLLAGLCVPSLAASTIDWDSKSGSLTIQPKYSDQVVSGCTFQVYQVADYDRDSSALHFTLTGAFQNPKTEDSNNPAVDINAAASDAEQLRTAAQNLARRTGNVTAEDKVYELKSGETKLTGLPVGVYLIVQTSAPGNYTVSSPFLAFLPYTESGSNWQYNVTANPKLGYNNPPPVDSGVTVNVIKSWDDAGFEEKRPSSITVTLMRDGAAYQTATLNSGNGWKTGWTKLSSKYTWTVEESGIPEGYINLTDSSVQNSVQTVTITNTYDEVPLSGALSVSKVWNDKGYTSKRPDGVKIGLYRDGKLNETVTLNSENEWSYSWTDLDENAKWTVSEVGVPKGYTATLKADGDAYTITNTYTKGGITPPKDETTITDGDVPKTHAPQTGLTQWPIPILAGAGAVLIIAGITANRKKKHEER
jgi:hypothetical protein